MIRRSALALGLAVTGLLLFASSASAQYEDPGSIIVDDPNPDVGDSITVTGSACGEPDVDVTVSITQNGQTIVIGTATTGPDGSYTLSGAIPASFTNGTAVITDSCGGRLTITIGSVAGTSLPRTGSESGALARVAVGLVAAGGLLLLATRKRVGGAGA
jgi:LPXTG-motif cell wall-anchored protein